jgi:hypothetical protein
MILFIVPLAVVATVLTYAATYQVLKGFGLFESPRLIAVITALLSGLGLLSLGSVIVPLILLPYAALGLSLLFLLLLRWVSRGGPGRSVERLPKNELLEPTRRVPGGVRRPTNRKKSACFHLREAPPTKE